MSDATIADTINRLVAGEEIGRHGAAAALELIMDGHVNEAQTAAFLIALRGKGESPAEIAGLAEVIREKAVPVRAPDGPFVDTCGTGGGISTFNISTAAAFVAAGAGVAVAKHGNRSSTSKSGSADVLEALGADIDLHPDAVAECLAETGVGFMFAPRHHPSFKHVVPVRRALGVHTVFNLIGPLANPAGAPRQVLGVADPAALGRIAAALAELGSERALVVRGRDGMDELSTAEISDAYDVRDGTATHIRVDPAVLGITRPWPEALKGGEPHENAAVITAVLEGEPGAPREVVALNAGAAIWIAGAAEDLAHGYETALRSIDGGAARERCAAFVAATKRLAAA
ncbi:MAG: anthranilate phosphoribosyltransferase [Thermoleophilia bacterium]|nr:anthranilate phosphoribosyltransferase [Thermoleophilia bacterium]